MTVDGGASEVRSMRKRFTDLRCLQKGSPARWGPSLAVAEMR